MCEGVVREYAQARLRLMHYAFIHSLLDQEEFQRKLISLAEEKIFVAERYQYLLREGETEQYIYCIRSGAVRAYLQNEFEELTIRFGYRGNIITSIRSFISDKPSDLYLQAIRKTEYLRVRKSDFYTWLNGDSSALPGYARLLEQLIIDQLERETDLLTYSPSERLKRVLRRSPQLFQEIPMKYIASYLRMTPETISRLLNS